MSKTITSLKECARICSECIKDMDNHDTETNYEAAYGVLQDIIYDSDQMGAIKIARQAISSDEDDMFDRLGTFVEAMEQIVRLAESEK